MNSLSSACTGAKFVRFDSHYSMWVGAILCDSADNYKLYMSDSPDGAFLEIADYAGHGEDHCELVDPGFSLTNEVDITSGGCTDCSLGKPIEVTNIPVFARGHLGERFTRVSTPSTWPHLTTTTYACGVSIRTPPSCAAISPATCAINLCRSNCVSP